MSFFTKILSGVEWFGKEVGKAFTALPKIITLTNDAEKVAADSLPIVISVVEDVVLKDLAALVTALGTAYAAKALNISADKSVVSAFETLCKDFSTANYQDFFTAIEKLVLDARTLDATVLADLKKLEADA
jgi:hypothetical protein